MEFNIQRNGRKWSRDEVKEKYYKLCPEKIELIEGKMDYDATPEADEESHLLQKNAAAAKAPFAGRRVTEYF